MVKKSSQGATRTESLFRDLPREVVKLQHLWQGDFCRYQTLNRVKVAHGKNTAPIIPV